jgi:pimeloyl-ACP methyl ester carboxylesterase
MNRMSRTHVPGFVDRTATVHDQLVHFVDGGAGQPVVLLHGWGGQIASFGPIPAQLAERFRVIAIDLPGFGESPVPGRPWGARDYGDSIAALLTQLGTSPVVLVGHSHGGRTAIALAADHPELVRKLVLIDSAGIVPRRGSRYYARIYLIKAARRLLSLPGLRNWKDTVMRRVYRLAGSSDFNAAANPVLRATLVKLVNEDLRGLLPRIAAPTLLIWGTEDRDTPLGDGKLMERLIPDAGLVVFEGAGHFSYLDQPAAFLRVMTHFAEN